MKDEENSQEQTSYPWKSFSVFTGIYLLTLFAHYPSVKLQAEVYLDIMDGFENISATSFVLLALAQPLLFGLIAIYFGNIYARRIGLRSLISERLGEQNLLEGKPWTAAFKDSLPTVILFAVIIAVVNTGTEFIFGHFFLDAYQTAFSVPNISQILSNLFYGGIGQEILLRWGVMTMVIYVLSSRGRQHSQWIYIIGIVFTAVIYTASQYTSITQGQPFSSIILVKLILQSGVEGFLFGWLYYRFHIEAAMISHFIANTLIILGYFVITWLGM